MVIAIFGPGGLNIPRMLLIVDTGVRNPAWVELLRLFGQEIKNKTESTTENACRVIDDDDDDVLTLLIAHFPELPTTVVTKNRPLQKCISMGENKTKW